jgi:hypothetical protein
MEEINEHKPRFWQKKWGIFGKQIPALLIMGILFAGLGSAAIVNYLSNTKTMTVSIESPMVMKFDGEGYADTATKDLGLVQGGESVTFKIWGKNRADVTTLSYPITTIISNNDWTGSEFSSLFYSDAQTTKTNILSMLYVVQDDGSLKSFTAGSWVVANKKSLKLFFDNTPDGIAQKYSHSPGEESWNILEIVTNSAITPDNYQIKMCHLNDLTGACA